MEKGPNNDTVMAIIYPRFITQFNPVHLPRDESVTANPR
jgi:hypothetical protein